MLATRTETTARFVGLRPPTVVALVAALTVWLARVALGRGQDWSFDTVSYHAIYAVPLLRSSGSIGRSHLAAGAYLNPILDAPFAWGVRHVNPRAVTVGLVVVQAVAIALVATTTMRFALGQRTLPGHGRREVLAFAIAWVLAARLALGGLASAQLGAAFGDLTSATPAALGLFLIIGFIIGARSSEVGSSTASRVRPVVLFASALMGCSAGLKLTNSPHAVAFLVALLFIARERGWSVRSIFGYCVGGLGLGWLVAGGPWAVRLVFRYENPLFPLANKFFGSSWLRRPDGTDLDLSVTRFPIRRLDDLALVAFRVARGGLTVSELALRDPRWLLCQFCIVCTFISEVRWRIHSRTRAPGKHRRSMSPTATAAAFVLVFWTVSFVTWAVVFGNGRYAVLLEVMTPLVVVSAIVRMLGNHRPSTPGMAGIPTSPGTLLLAVVLTVSVTMATQFSNWNHVEFGKKWFDFDTSAVPDLRDAMLIAPTDLEPLNLGLIVLKPKAFSHLSAAMLLTRLGQRELSRIAHFPGRRFAILGGVPGTEELSAANLRATTTCYPLPAAQGFAYRVCQLETIT